MYTVATKYGYASHLTLSPDSELRFVCRPAPPDRKRGASDARLKLVSTATAAPTCEAGGSALAVDANFTATKKDTVKRSGYGEKSSQPVAFTARARRSVRWGAAAIEREFGKENCYFVTFSLPGGSELAMTTFALWSSWLLDLLNKKLARLCVWVDGKCYRLSTWELQKRGALHLHLLVVAVDDSFIPNLQSYYVSLLEKLSDSTGVDMFQRANGSSWRDRVETLVKIGRKKGRWVNGTCRVVDLMCDAKRVQKSVTSYLSKYMSKGGSVSGQTPARWWSMSKGVRNLIAKYTIRLPLSRTNAEGATAIDEFVRDAFESCNISAECLRNRGLSTEFRTGYIAWDEYGKLKELLYAIGETVTGYLQSLGHVDDVLRIRRQLGECLLEQLQSVSDDMEQRRESEALMAAYYATTTSIGRQIQQSNLYQLGIHVDYLARRELKQMRRQLEERFAK